MESLLANYGSEDEDEDSPPLSPTPVEKPSTSPAPSVDRHSIFASLPPPRNCTGETPLWDDEVVGRKSSEGRSSGRGSESEGPAPRTTLFTSLPPPKNTSPEYTSGPRVTDSQTTTNSYAGEEKRSVSRLYPTTGLSDRSITVPSSEFLGRPSGNSSYSVGQSPPSSSVFSSLSAPSGTKPAPQKVQKKVVEFRPPVNYAMLEPTEEELEHKSKRSKVFQERERATQPRVGGLVASLPPPKNNLGAGAALGGGHGGRRTLMETVSNSGGAVEEVISNLSGTRQNTESKADKVAEVNVAGHMPEVLSDNHGVEQATRSGGVYYNTDNTSNYAPQPQTYEEMHTLGHFGSDDGYTVQNNYDQQSLQFPQPTAFGDQSHHSQGNGPVHALAEVMKKERRKGRDDPPPEMIEVKQADLTGGSKLREDKLRTTGIAFGPSYKPTSSNKDKPSKLLRRKHQIGALYFDMKQNEMNLLDRRAKGNLTKAETQAKYGW